MVLGMDFYVKPEFLEGIYDSCNEVYNPAADMKAVEFMCGSLGSACNSERWFSFMGKSVSGGGLAPFDINYKYLENSTEINGRNMTPLNDIIYPCETSVSCFVFGANLKNSTSNTASMPYFICVSSFSWFYLFLFLEIQYKEGSTEVDGCGCVDCQASCTAIKFEEIYSDEGYSININVDTVIFDLIWTIVGVTAAFLLIVMLSYLFRKLLLNLLISGKFCRDVNL